MMANQLIGSTNIKTIATTTLKRSPVTLRRLDSLGIFVRCKRRQNLLGDKDAAPLLDIRGAALQIF